MISRRGPLHKLSTNRSAGSVMLMTPLSSGHMEQISWRGFLTIWMAFIETYNFPSRWRKTATYPYSTLTYTGEWMAPWAIRSTENLSTLTSTWILDPSNILIQVILSTLAHRTRALCYKESLGDELGSSKPLLWKMVIVSNRYDGPSTRRLEPPSRKRSPPLSLFFRMSRRLTAGSAECWPNTPLNVMACRLGRSPDSFLLWRTTWDWWLWEFTAYPASVVRSTSDRVVVLQRPEYKSTTGTYGFGNLTNRRRQNKGSTITMSLNSTTPGFSLLYAAIWNDLGRQWSWSSTPTIWTWRMAWLWVGHANLSFAFVERVHGPLSGGD